ncbi:MAG: hypothetical protein IT170_03315 [Bryobacterales bacterium]|nr:hypothetical protein [Bryobacterales bacterium]
MAEAFEVSCYRKRFGVTNIGHICRLVVILLCLAVAQSPSQESSRYRIQGKVVDGEGGTAVSDATIIVRVLSVEGGILRGAKPGESGETEQPRTGLSGGFSIPVAGPGRYSISARREGYGERNNSVAVISEENPSATVKLEIFRAAAITGRVLDAEEKSPLKGVTVIDLKCNWRKGNKVLLPMKRTVTDDNGAFHLEDLLPGEHILLIESQEVKLSTAAAEPATATKKGEDRPAVYRMLWPSGGKESTGAVIVGGSENSVGDILVEKRELGAIRGVARSSDCGEGAEVEVWLTGTAESGTRANVAGGRQPCGVPWEIAPVPPGPYQIQSWIADRSGVNQRHFYSEISLAEKQTLDLDLGLSPPMIMRLTLRDASGNPYVPDTSLTIAISPVVSAGTIEEYLQKLSAGYEGNVLAYYRSSVDLQITGLRRNEYVKELKYNGSAAASTRFMPNPGALSHKLEAVIGADAAILAPVLADEKHATNDTAIVIAPWPARLREVIPEYKTARRREDGRYESVWLPPGKYRAIAITLPDVFLGLDRPIDKPGVLASALSDAAEIVLAPGETRQPQVEFVELK